MEKWRDEGLNPGKQGNYSDTSKARDLISESAVFKLIILHLFCTNGCKGFRWMITTKEVFSYGKMNLGTDEVTYERTVTEGKKYLETLDTIFCRYN